MKKIMVFFIVTCFAAGTGAQEKKAIKMGYRTTARPPLISMSPNNTGLYHDIYSRAAKKIGFKLEIVRAPKKRVLSALKNGEIDFYPGFTFSEERAKYAYYMVNGLPGKEVGISRMSLPEITNLNQLKGKTLIRALGGPERLDGITGVKTFDIREMTIEKAIRLLKFKRGDFYIYNGSSIKYYLKENNIKDIKIHPNLYPDTPLYIGFSLKSPHFKATTNPDYLPSAPMSVDNFPIKLIENSTAYKFAAALKEMKESGETDQLYRYYYE